MPQQQQCTQTFFNAIQDALILTHRFQLVIGCSILLYIITNIYINKLDKQIPIRLFMYSCICYFIGMFIVLLHNNYFTYGHSFYYSDKSKQLPSLLKVLQEMYNNGRLIFCGLQAFINLYAYDLAYFFAVLVTYYMNLIGKGYQDQFMRRKTQAIITILFLLLMFGIYLIPLILMFKDYQKQPQYKYSYAPTGFVYQFANNDKNIDCKADIIMYCGINSNPAQPVWSILSILNVYGLAILMLVIHLYLIRTNRIAIQAIIQVQDKNNNQKMCLIWDKISIGGFVIQFINLLKVIWSISLTISQSQPNSKPQQYSLSLHIMYVIIIFLNYIFDIYPCLLLYFYVKYIKSNQSIVKSSTLLEEDYGHDKQ